MELGRLPCRERSPALTGSATQWLVPLGLSCLRCRARSGSCLALWVPPPLFSPRGNPSPPHLPLAVKVSKCDPPSPCSELLGWKAGALCVSGHCPSVSMGFGAALRQQFSYPLQTAGAEGPCAKSSWLFPIWLCQRRQAAPTCGLRAEGGDVPVLTDWESLVRVQHRNTLSRRDQLVA